MSARGGTTGGHVPGTYWKDGLGSQNIGRQINKQTGDVTDYRLETQAVRITGATDTEADVIRLEDELCVASQDECEDIATSIIGPEQDGAFIRSIVLPFTVGRSCEVNGAEIQPKTTPYGLLADSGSIWLSIWQATNADFTPAASRVLVGVIGPIHNHRISYLYWEEFFVLATDVISLVSGVNYFLCISADDPSAVAPDPWDGSTNVVNAQVRYHADVGTFVYRSTLDFPDAAGVYTAFDDHNVWWRLYEHKNALIGIPIAIAGSVPTSGEMATMQRVSGVHGQNYVIGMLPGGSSGGSTRAHSGGGSTGTGPHALLSATHHDTVAGPPVSMALVYGNATPAWERTSGLYWDEPNDRLGIGAVPSYPLHIVGQGYFTTQVGVGATPSSTIASRASVSATSDALYSAFGGSVSPGTGAIFTAALYGINVDARQSQSFNMTGVSPAGLTGVWGKAIITADNATVSAAIGIRGFIQTTAGAARAFTTAYLFYGDTSIAAGGSIGTLYGFYMAACTGTVRWGVYIADTTAPSYFASDVVLAATVKARWDGSTAGDTYTYELSANYLVDVVGGTATFGRVSGHVGVPATGRIYLDGVACTGDTYIYELSANYLVDVVGGTATFGRVAGHVGVPATGQVYLDGIACTGHTSIRESADNIITFRTNAVDQWNVGINAFYPVADNSEDIGTSTLGIGSAFFSDAGAAVAVTAGEQTYYGTAGSFSVYTAAGEGRVANKVYSLAADATVYTTAGEFSEANVASCAIPAAFLIAGNVIEVFAEGHTVLVPSSTVDTAHEHTIFRLEGDELFNDNESQAPDAGQKTWVWFRYKAYITMKSATAASVFAEMAYYSLSDTVGSPFGGTFSEAEVVEKWYQTETDIVVAGAMTVAVRWYATNANHGDMSHMTVKQFIVWVA